MSTIPMATPAEINGNARQVFQDGRTHLAVQLCDLALDRQKDWTGPRSTFGLRPLRYHPELHGVAAQVMNACRTQMHDPYEINQLVEIAHRQWSTIDSDSDAAYEHFTDVWFFGGFLSNQLYWMSALLDVLNRSTLASAAMRAEKVSGEARWICGEWIPEQSTPIVLTDYGYRSFRGFAIAAGVDPDSLDVSPALGESVPPPGPAGALVDNDEASRYRR